VGYRGDCDCLLYPYSWCVRLDCEHVLLYRELDYSFSGWIGIENVSCWESIMKEIETMKKDVMLDWEKQADEQLVHVKHCPICNQPICKHGDRNPQWKADDVGFTSLHQWIREHKPKVDLCERCNKTPPYDVANISGEYKRDINDFEWLCRSCHMNDDGRINNLKRLPSTSGIPGIWWDKNRNKWMVQIRKKGEKIICVGRFESIDSAVKALKNRMETNERRDES